MASASRKPANATLTRVKLALADGVLPVLLRDVYVNRRSGRLHVVRGEERYSICFAAGHITHCESSSADANLGQLMVRQGLLAEPARREAAAAVGRAGKRLGEILVAMKAIDAATLERALALQVREILLRVFGWTGGVCAFQEEQPRTDAPVTLRLSTAEMIMEAVRESAVDVAIHAGLGDLDRVIVLSTDPLLRFQRVALSPADGFVLSRVDGVASARELLQTVPLPAGQAERSLFGLLCIGMVEYLPPLAELEAASAGSRRADVLAAHAALGAQDHFQVLGIARDASQAEVTAAFHRRARRFHPDVHHDPALQDLRPQLEEIFARLARASEILRTPALRREYVAGLDRAARLVAPPPAPSSPESPDDAARRAEAALQLAAERSKDGRPWEAVGILEGLVTVSSGVLRRRARLMLAELQAKDPRTLKSSEEQLLKVVEESPDNVEARVRLARHFRERGIPSRALEYARQALALEPGERRAEEVVDQLTEKGGKGLLGRVFRP
jgi:hypothetical protein